MKRITLMGLGLMGGSIGLALKARGFPGVIHAYARRPETRAQAFSLGVADAVFDDPVEAVRDADVVIYCTPILTIPALVEASKAGLKPGAVLTDVGSTKAELARHVSAIMADAGAVFVGSHPVAGSEQTGIEAARADLYAGALVVVTPETVGAGQGDEAVSVIKSLWESVGAWVKVVPAQEHDRLMARTSHLSHLVASLLAVTVGRDDDPSYVGTFCGTGFRDTSRVADGSPEVWHDIVCTNAQAIRSELVAYRQVLDSCISWMDSKEFEKVKELLEKGRDDRRALMAQSPAKMKHDAADS